MRWGDKIVNLSMADEDICLETRATQLVLWSKTSVV
jgi:hypothetical protein